MLSCVYSSHVHFQIEASDEKIDIEKLKVREKIHFYDDILLFEDELSDNGTSILSVKIVSLPPLIEFIGILGAQWLSGRVLDSRPGAAGSSITGVTALCP